MQHTHTQKKRKPFSNSVENCLAQFSTPGQLPEVYEHWTKQNPLMLLDVYRDRNRHGWVKIMKGPVSCTAWRIRAKLTDTFLTQRLGLDNITYLR